MIDLTVVTWDCLPMLDRTEYFALDTDHTHPNPRGAEVLAGFVAMWGWVHGQPHMARLTNAERGEYKGWPIAREELPLDRDGRLVPRRGGEDDA